jgi:hypothetical protein
MIRSKFSSGPGHHCSNRGSGVINQRILQRTTGEEIIVVTAAASAMPGGLTRIIDSETLVRESEAELGMTRVTPLSVEVSSNNHVQATELLNTSEELQNSIVKVDLGGVVMGKCTHIKTEKSQTSLCLK